MIVALNTFYKLCENTLNILWIYYFIWIFLLKNVYDEKIIYFFNVTVKKENFSFFEDVINNAYLRAGE